MPMDLTSSSRSRTQQHLPLLPPELLEEILSWLPVKSLLQFRCVSKSWRSLIDDNQGFVQSHLSKSLKNPTCARHNVILISAALIPKFRYCPLQIPPAAAADACLHRFDDHVFDSITTPLIIVGVCNGLICLLHDRRQFYLWNPSLRLSKQLPFLDRKLSMGGSVTKYGFGYDELSGDYKVFALASVFWVTGKYEAVGKVYSLKTDSWNQIVTERDGDSFGGGGKFVSGRLHWGNNLGWDWKIESFDLKCEKYDSVALPVDLQGNYRASLGDFGGCLCMLCEYRCTRVDVWVMKEYGVRDSWNKVVTIPYPGPERLSFSYLFYVVHKREVWFRFGYRFLVYSLDNNELQHRFTVNLFRCCEPEVYVESLVSFAPSSVSFGPDRDQA